MKRLLFLLVLAVPARTLAAETASEPGPAGPPNLLSINVRDVDVRDVLWALARQANVNLAMTESVKGRVTIRLRDVGWEEALTTVVQTTGLAFRRDAGLITVMTPAEAQAAGGVRPGAVETRTLVLKHARVQAVLDAVRARLSEKGSVTPVAETNSLILSDVAEKIQDVAALVASVDVPPPQEWIRVSSPTPGEYLVSLDVKDVDVRDLLWSLARQVNVNIVLAEGVKGRVTIRLKESPWNQALDTIVRTAGLSSRREGDLITIAEPPAPSAAQAAEVLPPPLITRVFPLKFAKIEEADRVVQAKLSDRGKAVPMIEGKSLMVVDIPEKVQEIESMIPSIDVPPRQVLIEVVITDMKLLGEKDIGVNWNTVFNKNQTIGVGEQTLEPNRGSTVPTQFGDLAPGGVTGEGALVGLQIVRGAWTATTLIDLLQQNTDGKILASPKILVLSGRKAQINTIEEVPYQELTQTSGGGQISSVQFKEVGVKLEVTPTINDRGDIILNVKPEQSVRTGEVLAGVPVIDTRKADTTLLMKDGETAVLGGLRRKIQNTQVKMIPGLGKIPGLGRLFRRESKSTEVRELVVFLIPRLYTATPLGEKEQQALEEIRSVTDDTPIQGKQ